MHFDMSTAYLLLLFVTIAGCLSKSDTESIPCHAGDDQCPSGSYCSTTTGMCWECRLCGNIDILFNWMPTKCLCDGGANGDPFAICSKNPPDGETRDPIIRSYDDIEQELRVFFNGTRRREVCPTTATNSESDLNTTEAIRNEIFTGFVTATTWFMEGTTNITSKDEVIITTSSGDTQAVDFTNRKGSLIVMLAIEVLVMVACLH